MPSKSFINDYLYLVFMGRIKTTLIKRTGLKLLAKYRKEFKTDFQENKKIVEQFIDVPSKKLRNIIAGYITKLVKKENEHDLTLGKVTV